MSRENLVALVTMALACNPAASGCAPSEEGGVSMTVHPLRGAFTIPGDGIPGCEDDTNACVALGIYRDPQTTPPSEAATQSNEKEFLELYAPFDWNRFWSDDNRATKFKSSIGIRSPASFASQPAKVPPDLPLHVTLMMGLRPSSGIPSTPPSALAHVGPLTLPLGYRAHFSVAVYPVFSPSSGGGVTDVQRCEDPNRPGLAAPPDTFAAAAVTLSDGRVLVAGGFRVLGETTCPAWATAGGEATALCAEAEATNEAWIFDPTSGCFFTPRGASLFRKRGGARATRTSDGTVLVTGGAERAIVVHQVDKDRNVAVIWLLPEDTPSNQAVMGSFELFDPNHAADEEDSFRDGDPARGGFLDSGTLAQPRFLHAAVRFPDTQRNAVVLAGGTESPATLEIVDIQRPGGPGPLPMPVSMEDGDESPRGIYRFAVPRFLPTAFSLQRGGDRYIVVAGGFLPRDSEEEPLLADVFKLDSSAEGIRLQPANGAQAAIGAFSSSAFGPPSRLAYLAPTSAAGELPVGLSTTQVADDFVRAGFVFGGLGTPCQIGPGELEVPDDGWMAVPEVLSAPVTSLGAFLQVASPGLFGPKGFCPPALQRGAPAWGLTLDDDGSLKPTAIDDNLPVHAQGQAFVMDSGRIALFGGPRTSRDADTAPERRELISLFDAVRPGMAEPLDLRWLASGEVPRLGTLREGEVYGAVAPITPGGALLLPGVRLAPGTTRLEVAGSPGVLYVTPRCFDLPNRTEFCNRDQ